MSSAHTDDLRRVAYCVLDGFALQRARTGRITLVAETVDGARAYTQLTLDRVESRGCMWSRSSTR